MNHVLAILNPLTAGEAFRRLAPEESWKKPLIIVLVAGLLSAAGIALVYDKTESLRSAYLVKEMDVTIRDEVWSVMTVTKFATSLLLVVLGWGTKSVAFYSMGRLFKGTPGSISSTVRLMGYTYLPLIIKGLVDVYRGVTYELPSYEEYVSSLRTPDVLETFSDPFSVFLLWAIVLMILAVRQQYNLGNVKAILAVLIPYGIYWIIML
ncbi:MAG: YIP1 family protein [Theionarchaea archaeon]|nr:YIP1 family protein [Theionarchaea archaeon]